MKKREQSKSVTTVLSYAVIRKYTYSIFFDSHECQRDKSYDNEPYPQLRHNLKMAALWGDNVQRSYGEVDVLLCSP